MSVRKLDKARGSMIGAAYGDSNWHLGYRATYRTDLVAATASGLLDMIPRNIDCIWDEYLRWYWAQKKIPQMADSGLAEVFESARMGTFNQLHKDVKGCNAVERVSPVGIAYYDDTEFAFHVALCVAVMTHGEPEDYMPAAYLATMIAYLISGESLEASMSHSREKVIAFSASKKKATIDAIDRATVAVNNEIPVKTARYFRESEDEDQRLRGSEALAIALYSVLKSPEDPIQAVAIASSLSPEPGSALIAGAIAGAMHGLAPFMWELADQGIDTEPYAKLDGMAMDLLLKEP